MQVCFNHVFLYDAVDQNEILLDLTFDMLNSLPCRQRKGRERGVRARARSERREREAQSAGRRLGPFPPIVLRA